MEYASFHGSEKVGRARSNTYGSSGTDTPPLYVSDGVSSSPSEGSMSSIDVDALNAMLAGLTVPTAGPATTRPQKPSHRRRISTARASLYSVHETIQEESQVFSYSPSPLRIPTALPSVSAPVVDDSIHVASASNASSPRNSGDWGVSMRRYYALKSEAQEALEESKRVWPDTAFSTHALQGMNVDFYSSTSTLYHLS